MQNSDLTAQLLHALEEMGVRVSIDDFGTGHSSLSYLKNFRIDTLKIDKSFVGGLPGDANDAAIVAATIAMARSLNLAVVAEGVETKGQLEFLRAHGCDMVQGYLLGRPAPPAQLEERVASGADAGRSARVAIT